MDCKWSKRKPVESKPVTLSPFILHINLAVQQKGSTREQLQIDTSSASPPSDVPGSTDRMCLQFQLPFVPASFLRQSSGKAGIGADAVTSSAKRRLTSESAESGRSVTSIRTFTEQKHHVVKPSAWKSHIPKEHVLNGVDWALQPVQTQKGYPRTVAQHDFHRRRQDLLTLESFGRQFIGLKVFKR